MSQDQIKKDKDALKRARLADALKANLRRRKEQMRARKIPDSPHEENDKNNDTSKT